MHGFSDKTAKNLALWRSQMYEYTENNQPILPHEFFLPFGGTLNADNQWCKLAALIPWNVIEEKYAKCFKSRTGQRAYSVRIALGTLIIQNMKTLSDVKVVEEISENPYMQYFLGFTGFVQEQPFDPSLIVHFRKRLNEDILNEVNELIAKPKFDDKDDDDDDTNNGVMILDATCTPADIHYPTDLFLLNGCREKLEEVIDVMHQQQSGDKVKPRTYRNCARKAYLNIDKKKNKKYKEIRKGIGQQLRYVKRDLSIIENMSNEDLSSLSRRQYQNLLVCNELYRQQSEMYHNKTRSIQDRIVSINRPSVRPIVRGKTNADVEFGAKLAISVVNGYSYAEELSFDAFNEGITLKRSLETYKRRFGFYPKTIMADKIYRNRENISWCKSLGIRLSGPPLGRPSSDPLLQKEQRRQEREDTKTRNGVEGKFGEGKRFYGLDKIMAHRDDTTMSVIIMQLIAMNCQKRLRDFLVSIFKTLFLCRNRFIIMKLGLVQ